MILPILANVELPSAIVASALIICPTIFFTAVAIRHTIRDVEKLAGYFASAFGVLLGVFITYFFTREATQAKIQAVQAGSEAQLRFAQTEVNAYKAASDAVKTKLSPEDAKWFEKMIYTGATTGNGTTPETPKPKSKFQYQIYRGAQTPTPTPWTGLDAISNAVGYAKFFSRSYNAVICVFDEAGNVIDTHEHAGDFKEWWANGVWHFEPNKKPPHG